jgi:hypothetical protein
VIGNKRTNYITSGTIIKEEDDTFTGRINETQQVVDLSNLIKECKKTFDAWDLRQRRQKQLRFSMYICYDYDYFKHYSCDFNINSITPDQIKTTYSYLLFRKKITGKTPQQTINQLQQVLDPYPDLNDRMNKCWCEFLVLFLSQLQDTNQLSKIQQLKRKFPNLQQLPPPQNKITTFHRTLLQQQKQKQKQRRATELDDAVRKQQQAKEYITSAFPDFCKIRPHECDKSITIFNKTDHTSLRELTLEPGTSSYFFIGYSTNSSGWWLVWKNNVPLLNQHKTSKLFQNFRYPIGSKFEPGELTTYFLSL